MRILPLLILLLTLPLAQQDRDLGNVHIPGNGILLNNRVIDFLALTSAVDDNADLPGTLSYLLLSVLRDTGNFHGPGISLIKQFLCQV